MSLQSVFDGGFKKRYLLVLLRYDMLLEPGVYDVFGEAVLPSYSGSRDFFQADKVVYLGTAKPQIPRQRPDIHYLGNRAGKRGIGCLSFLS